jgi:uncharacterized membrane protein
VHNCFIYVGVGSSVLAIGVNDNTPKCGNFRDFKIGDRNSSLNIAPALLFRALLAVVVLVLFVVMTIIVIASLVIGHSLGVNHDNTRPILAIPRERFAIACIARNIGLALFIAILHNVQQKVIPTIIAYVILGAVLGNFYSIWNKRKLEQQPN